MPHLRHTSSLRLSCLLGVGLALAAGMAAAATPRLPSEPSLAGEARRSGAAAQWKAVDGGVAAGVDVIGPVSARWSGTPEAPSKAVEGSGSGGAIGTGAEEGEAPATTPHPTPAGALIASYGGIWGTGFAPSDTALAVGPQHLVQAVNSSLAVLGRSGSVLLGPQTLASFFGSVLPTGWRGLLFEPQVTFSLVHDKFVLLTSAIDRVNQTSYFFLAVSQTADPTGSWWLYRYGNSFPRTDLWLAEPSLGVDAFGVHLTGNRYRWSDESFFDATLWTLRPEVMAGELGTPWVFPDLRWDDGTPLAFLRAATPHSISGEGASYFVASRPRGGEAIRLLRLTGDRGDDPQLTSSEVRVPRYRPLGVVVAQPETDRRLDGGESHVADAVYVQRQLYLALTSDPHGDGRSSSIRVIGLDTVDGSVHWRHELAGGDGWYYLFPGLTIAGGEDPEAPLGLVFAVVQRDRLHPSIGAAILRREGPEVLRLVKLGEGPYVDSALWGRRSSAVWDWFRPGILWGSAQYAGLQSFWRTQNFALATAGDSRAAGPPPCLPSRTVACFQDGRFAVGIERGAGASSMSARLAPAASDASALFWFFSPENWEVLVKVLDGCAIDGRFWVLSAASTAEPHRLWVMDLLTGQAQSYPHPGGSRPALVDTSTFVCDG